MNKMGTSKVGVISKAQKALRGEPFGIFENPVCCKIFKKFEGTLKIFKKTPKKPKAGRGKSHSAEKIERVPICFAMVLYFMLEALDAFKIQH